MNFLALVSAVSLSLAGFTFDSDAVKALPIPYPLVSLSLGGICIVSFLCSQNAKMKLSRPVGRIGFVFLIIYIIGLISSLTSGAGDIFALGMKSATLFMNFLFLSFGAILYKSKFSLKFSKYFFWISLVLALLISCVTVIGINKNWVGITLMFSLLFYWLSKEEQISHKNLFFWLLMVALYAGIILKARGVFVASAGGALYIGLVSLFPNVIKKWANRFVVIILPLASVFMGGFGVWLYRSHYYPILTAWSIQAIGKNLDSSRLERWDMGFNLLKERLFLGWGVDAHLSRAASVVGYGDLHNLWWEYLFRFGLIGGCLFLYVFMYTSRILYFGHQSTVNIVAYLVIFVFLSVYSLGGVTHWPGAYMFWFTMGLLLSRSTYNKGDLNK